MPVGWLSLHEEPSPRCQTISTPSPGLGRILPLRPFCVGASSPGKLGCGTPGLATLTPLSPIFWRTASNTKSVRVTTCARSCATRLTAASRAASKFSVVLTVRYSTATEVRTARLGRPIEESVTREPSPAPEPMPGDAGGVSVARSAHNGSRGREFLWHVNPTGGPRLFDSGRFSSRASWAGSLRPRSTAARATA